MNLDKPIEATNDQTNEAEDDLFGDETTTETTEESKPAESEKQPGEAPKTDVKPEEKTEEKPEDFFDVKYNGETKRLTREEAINLAQKGMNYDKRNQELETLKNSKSLTLISRLAKQSGMSIDEYANQIEKAYDAQAITNIENKLKSSHPDADEATLHDLADSQYQMIKHQQELDDQKNKQNQIDQEAQTKADNDKRMNQMIDDFVSVYPDVDLNTLKDEDSMWKMISDGKSLLEAYQTVELQKLKKQIETEKTATANKKKTTGSMSGDSSASASDPFLEGFND